MKLPELLERLGVRAKAHPAPLPAHLVAGGERQNVCYGETYATQEEADAVLDVLVGDGRADAAGPFAAYVAEVQP